MCGAWHDQADPVVTFRPVRGGFEVEAHDEARVTDGAGKAVSKIPRPTGTEGYRVRLDAPGRPSSSPCHPVGSAGMKLRQIAHAAERTVRLRSVGVVQIVEGEAVRLGISPAGVTVQHGS